MSASAYSRKPPGLTVLLELVVVLLISLEAVTDATKSLNAERPKWWLLHFESKGLTVWDCVAIVMLWLQITTKCYSPGNCRMPPERGVLT